MKKTCALVIGSLLYVSCGKDEEKTVIREMADAPAYTSKDYCEAFYRRSREIAVKHRTVLADLDNARQGQGQTQIPLGYQYGHGRFNNALVAFVLRGEGSAGDLCGPAIEARQSSPGNRIEHLGGFINQISHEDTLDSTEVSNDYIRLGCQISRYLYWRDCPEPRTEPLRCPPEPPNDCWPQPMHN